MTDATDTRTPYAQDADQAEALWCLGELQTVLAAAEQTGEVFSLVEHEARAGHAPPWHRQPRDDETFYVLAGEITFWAETAERPFRRACAGGVVFIPRGTPHAFRVETETARWLTVSTPGGHERFYRASGDPAGQRTLPPASEPDMPKVAAAAAEHDVELLGPPPS